MGNAATSTERERAPTVLVVDDEPVICMLASNCLRDAGYRTLEAHNAQQAIDLLEKDERVDVVFSDVQMPGMDGFELQRWLRQHRPRVRVYFFHLEWKTLKRPADTWGRRVGLFSNHTIWSIWKSGFATCFEAEVALRYASSSDPLFFTLPTAVNTGRLTNASSFAGFISAAAASGWRCIHWIPGVQLHHVACMSGVICRARHGN